MGGGEGEEQAREGEDTNFGVTKSVSPRRTTNTDRIDVARPGQSEYTCMYDEGGLPVGWKEAAPGETRSNGR